MSNLARMKYTAFIRFSSALAFLSLFSVDFSDSAASKFPSLGHGQAVAAVTSESQIAEYWDRRPVNGLIHVGSVTCEFKEDSGIKESARTRRFVWNCLNSVPWNIFFTAVEEIFSAEQREEEWAGPIESRIAEANHDDANVSEIKGECHKSICRYDVSFFTAKQHQGWEEFLEKTRRPGTDSVLNLAYVSFPLDGKDTMRYYLFSLDPKAAYISPLQNLLRKIPKDRPSSS